MIFDNRPLSSAFTALPIILLLPCVVFSLSVPSKPCLEFAGFDCPRYHPDVFDGKVCFGCFCDDFEITNWNKFSNIEKAYALEDAFDRAQAIEKFDDTEAELEGCIPSNELKRQASIWRMLASNESKSTNVVEDEKPDWVDAEVPPPSKKVPIPISSTVAISTSAPIVTKNSIPNIDVSEAPGINCVACETAVSNERVSRELLGKKAKEQSIPPPTPCTRICRYNASCYDGKVCIGCFRDTHDIAQWSGMSHAEKMFSLEDAADRCHDLTSEGKDTDTFFEGGISEAALRSQATLWGSWKG